MYSGNGMIRGQELLERLIDGNRRFSGYGQIHPNETKERRGVVMTGQNPFAVVLACADSRVLPELIFDQGIGDLFVIRVAGHAMDRVVWGSIEYAVCHLHVPLIMVLGHSDCGAVKAAVTRDGEQEGYLHHIREAIQPALEGIADTADDWPNQVAKIHATRVARELRSSAPIFYERVEAGELMVVSAYYDLATGLVEVLVR